METRIGIIGQRIKELRLERGLTLEEAAERTGCSAGFLSQLERNRAAPSISMLYSIARALGVSITHFFPAVVNPTKVVRAEEREPFRFEGSPIIYTLLSTQFADRIMESLLVTIEPDDGSLPADEYRAHPGEEFGYVLDGTLRLWIENERYDLLPGDSIHFMATVKHRWENPGTKAVTALWVLTPPVF
jgi:transcriptional regulator with XRE-family HTH domain